MNPALRIALTSLCFSAVGFGALVGYESYTDQAVIPVPGDVPTIGFGSTDGVKLGDRTTPPKAVKRALQDIAKYEGALKQCVRAPLAQYEYDAFVSLAYNVGAAAFCGSSIPRKLDAGDYEAACKTILDFDGFRDRSKPKVQNPKTGKWEHPLVRIRGLTIRRQAEYKTCRGES